MKKNKIRLLIATLILSIMNLNMITIFAEETNIKFVGGLIEINGSINQAQAGVLVTAVVLEKGITKEMFLDPANFVNAYDYVHTFWQTETDAEGKYVMSIPLKSDITLDNYEVLVDSTAFSELKSQTITAVGLDTIKSIIHALDSASEQAQITNLMIENASLFDIDVQDYSVFSAEEQKIINDQMMNLDLSSDEVYSNINKIKIMFIAYNELVRFNRQTTANDLMRIIENTENPLGLDLTVYAELDKSNFADNLLSSNYTSIPMLQEDFLKKTILSAFNMPALSGTLKIITEKYTTIIGVDVSGNSDYKKVSAADLFKKVLEKRPFNTVNDIKISINSTTSSLLTPTSGSGSDKVSGGGGGGKSTSYVMSPISTPVPSATEPPVSEPSQNQQIHFEDVDNHWASAYINEMYAKGYVKGENKHFYPENNITRAEFVSIIARILNLSEGEAVYSDVQSNDWYYRSVNAAAKAGLISAAENFRPNDFISRQEIFKIIVKSYNYKIGPVTEESELSFADKNQIAPWAESYVKAVVTLKLVNGIEQDKGVYIKPGDFATRAEATVIMKRLTDLIK